MLSLLVRSRQRLINGIFGICDLEAMFQIDVIPFRTMEQDSGTPFKKRFPWRRSLNYVVIAICLIGAAIIAAVAFQRTAPDGGMRTRLIYRGILLFVIAIVAGLDLLFPKGQWPKSR